MKNIALAILSVGLYIGGNYAFAIDGTKDYVAAGFSFVAAVSVFIL